MFVSKTIFKSVLKLSHYAGLHAIGNTKTTKFSKMITNIYLSTLFAMFFFQIICLAVTLVFNLSKEDGSGVFCVLVIMVNNIILIVFYSVKTSEISRNYENMANFVEYLLEDPASNEFLNGVNKHAHFVGRFIQYYMTSVYVLLVIEGLIKGLGYVKILNLVTEESALIYVLPWEVNDHTFWPTLMFQIVSTALMTVVQQANHYYLMTMMILQTLCFRHLKTSFAHSLEKRNRSFRHDPSQLQLMRAFYEKQFFSNRSWHLERSAEERVKKWIQTHVQLLRLCKEFVDIYSPLLISYFLVMFLVLISGLFSITQNRHYYGLVEEILLGLYFAGIIFNLFMLSIAGSNLTFESVRTVEDVFHTPWYACSREVKSALAVISEVAKRPVQLAAFNSHYFNMSLHTFIRVMKAMSSFYIALVQIKDRASQGVTAN